MALMHQATITPTKQELMAAWLPTREWYDGVVDRDPVASFRLDDPAGEVGVECFLLGDAAGGGLFVPLTYRADRLAGVDEIGVMEHSVLGTRYVYDGLLDPVCVGVLATAIATGGTEAVEEVQAADGTRAVRDPGARARGTGTSAAVPDLGDVSVHDLAATTVVRAGDVELVVRRDLAADLAAAETLSVSWTGGTVDVAGLRPTR
ncbi:hypothetical protein EUA93_10215 [Nocardioides oleivorans]|uniref:Maltokinase N-terminal cap domain-containing protein n=1 Tax=Nocardioides oleivorans TaxID=273676 RepID=A0A4Q2S2R9_9ACTN|nr:hypothetical protein [Nocardioides oleivorans]RYB94685.1 hypothetical protein EUA93_10215 [Nocardioides oleivorans]